MNIVRLQIKNFLSISDVEIKPSHITQITGANNTGKTSILRAIQTALQGSTDPSLVKVGETQAEIIVEFSDGMKVNRKINSTGTQSVKVSKGDFETKAPQSMLNTLFEAHSFNPLELLDAKRRTEALLQVVPAKLTEADVIQALQPLPIPLPATIDYTGHGLKVITQLYDYFYSRRAEANKAVKQEQARLSVEAEKVSAVEPDKGAQEDDALNQSNGAHDAEIRELTGRQALHKEKRRELEILQQATDNAKHEIVQLQLQLNTEIQKAKEYQERADKARLEEVAFGAVQPRIDELYGLKARISDEKAKNANYRTWLAQKNNLEGQRKRAVEAEDFANSLGKCVELIRGPLKNSMMSTVQMPIPGITFEEDKFFFEGSAIENLSTSSSMKLACALARALAKKTKVICLDGCEALDEENYLTLKEQIKEDGYNYFITKVGEAFRDSQGDTVVKMDQGAAHVH